MTNKILFQHEGASRACSESNWDAARKEALEAAGCERNWDGEDGLPVQRDIIDSALQLFNEMQVEGVPAPDSVYPLAIGALMAEWHYADQTVVSAEIREPRKAEVLVWHPNRPAVFKTVQWGKTRQFGPKKKRPVARPARYFEIHELPPRAEFVPSEADVVMSVREMAGQPVQKVAWGVMPGRGVKGLGPNASSAWPAVGYNEDGAQLAA